MYGNLQQIELTAHFLIMKSGKIKNKIIEGLLF